MERSKIVEEPDKLAEPATVAKDGYEALMSGDDMVISGLKNKASVAMSNMLTDSKAADMMKKQQEPVNQNKK
jgi:short-subunit dehydrogenase